MQMVERTFTLTRGSVTLIAARTRQFSLQFLLRLFELLIRKRTSVWVFLKHAFWHVELIFSCNQHTLRFFSYIMYLYVGEQVCSGSPKITKHHISSLSCAIAFINLITTRFRYWKKTNILLEVNTQAKVTLLWYKVSYIT